MAQSLLNPLVTLPLGVLAIFDLRGFGCSTSQTSRNLLVAATWFLFCHASNLLCPQYFQQHSLQIRDISTTLRLLLNLKQIAIRCSSFWIFCKWSYMVISYQQTWSFASWRYCTLVTTNSQLGFSKPDSQNCATNVSSIWRSPTLDDPLGSFFFFFPTLGIWAQFWGSCRPTPGT